MVHRILIYHISGFDPFSRLRGLRNSEEMGFERELRSLEVGSEKCQVVYSIADYVVEEKKMRESLLLTKRVTVLLTL